MKNKKLVILAVLAVLIFTAAFIGYDYLTKNYQPEGENPSSEVSEPEVTETEDVSESSEPEEKVIMAPDFIVYDAEGNEVNLSDFSGKPVVINFWATWCGYCVSEMPSFEKAYAEYGDEVAFMMINVTDGQRETKESAMEFLTENGYTFPVYYDENLSATMAYGAWSLPATGFITESGVFLGGKLGAMSEEVLYSYIEVLLAAE